MAASTSARRIRYQLNRTKYLLDPEVEKLELLLLRSRETDQRNVLLLELALRTGARAQELLNLRLQDLNSFDQTIFIRGLKGSNDREIPVSQLLFARLEAWTRSPEYLEQKTPGQIFDLGYHRLRQIWDWYRPAPKKFHSLRHTFAIRLYQKTKDLRLVQLALGHRNITNTMVYADYIYSQQELKRLIL